MTQEEKIAQITTLWTKKGDVMNAAGDFDAAKAKQALPRRHRPFRAPERSHWRRRSVRDAVPR